MDDLFEEWLIPCTLKTSFVDFEKEKSLKYAIMQNDEYELQCIICLLGKNINETKYQKIISDSSKNCSVENNPVVLDLDFLDSR